MRIVREIKIKIKKKIHHRSVREKKLTGTVYKTLGFGFPLGQPSKIVRNELEDIPLESVSTSVFSVQKLCQHRAHQTL